MKDTVNFLARLGLAYIFLIAGYGKLTGYAGTEQYFQHLGLPTALLPLVILLELGGGVALVLGLFTRWVAVALCAFCIATGFIAHYHPGDHAQMINFMKNVAMAGGFLLLAIYGAERFSLDRRFNLPGR